MTFAKLSAPEAAEFIQNGQTVAFGGFTVAGTPLSVGAAVAERAAAERAAGREFLIRDIGVANGAGMDGILANAVSFRAPYQSAAPMRARINAGECRFVDTHLSHLTQAMRRGLFGPVDWAVIQAAEVTGAGDVLLTSAVGGLPTYCNCAERVIIEVNRSHPAAMLGFHDLYEPADPPNRREIPLYRPSDRIGCPLMRLNPTKIAGIVESDIPDQGFTFDPPSELTGRIGANVADFLAGEISSGRLPESFAPVQSGVGDIANAVLGALGKHPDVPAFEMYTEIAQEAVFELLEAERVRFISSCGWGLSQARLKRVHGDLVAYRGKLLLRPQEITNHPEIVRRLGLISMNTALEADVFGNVNSTHVMGRQIMNGIGGSGDFTRNAMLSIFTCPSTAKYGRISTIVPMATHVDHTEHDVQALVTEWGVADLRGLCPRDRANSIIENCAHPEYRDELRAYLKLSGSTHTAHTLRAAFAPQELMRQGNRREPRRSRPGPTRLRLIAG